MSYYWHCISLTKSNKIGLIGVMAAESSTQVKHFVSGLPRFAGDKGERVSIWHLRAPH